MGTTDTVGVHEKVTSEKIAVAQRKGECRFCKIIRGEERSYVVLDNEVCLAFLDYRPLFPGHCLLAPKTHFETLMDMPPELIPPLFGAARILAQVMEEALLAEGSFVAINNRISQSVPHLHVHVVPRRRNDGLRGFFWPRQRYADEDSILRVQASLRAAVEGVKSRG